MRHAPVLCPSLSLVLAASLATSGHAQQPLRIASVDAPQQVLDAIGADAATMQDLQLPLRQGAFQVDLTLDGQPHRLLLRPHDIRSPDFQLLVDDGVSLRQVPTPESVTYRGMVEGHPGSTVAAALLDGQLEAMIDLDGETWWAQPADDVLPGLPYSTHVVHRHGDYHRPGGCGTHEDGASASAPTAPFDAPTPPAASASALYECEIAIDASFFAYQRNGSSVTTTQNAVTSMMNTVDQVYNRDVQITYLITTVIVRSTSGLYGSGSPGGVLRQFENQWISQHSSIRRDVAHLFTGSKLSGTSTIGIANLSAICSQRNGFGVTWWFGGFNTRSDIACHELGHNWSGRHCDEQSPRITPCWTMNSSILTRLRFAPWSVGRIMNHAASRGCLTDPTGGLAPTLSSLNPASVESYQPSDVTVTGTLMSSVASVTVAGNSVPFTIIDNSTLTFSPPSPFDIAIHPVVVSNFNGDSNPINLDITGNHPSVIEVPVVAQRGVTDDYTIHTDRNWGAFLFISLSNQPSVLPGTVSFTIGNGFTELFYVLPILADNTGTAVAQIEMSSLAPSASLYWQAVTTGPGATLPFEVTNEGFSFIF
ncbi:MAG: M12 family metallo-peptidase [Planctomycetota bacterium]